jgi:uncharacterized membrane protein
LSEVLGFLTGAIGVAKSLADAFPAVIVTTVSWLAGAFGTMTIVQAVKKHRKQTGGRALSTFELRSLAFLLAAHITFIVAYKFFNCEFDIAVTHALLSGLMTPWVAALIIAFFKARAPKVVEAARDPFSTDNFFV